jgi:hypothetical protein
MGMFDTIRPKDPIVCPGCSKLFWDLQTKQLCCLGDVYEEGTHSVTRYPLRELTPEEKHLYDISGYRSTWKDHNFYPYVPDTDNPKFAAHPVYQQIEAHAFCEECHRMIIQKFRFDETGLLSIFEEPYFECDK